MATPCTEIIIRLGSNSIRCAKFLREDRRRKGDLVDTFRPFMTPSSTTTSDRYGNYEGSKLLQQSRYSSPRESSLKGMFTPQPDTAFIAILCAWLSRVPLYRSGSAHLNLLCIAKNTWLSKLSSEPSVRTLNQRVVIK